MTGPRSRSARVRRSGGPRTAAAPELVASGFTLENADAPILHRGYNLADMAHVLDMAEGGIIPVHAQRALLQLLLEAYGTEAADFPYDPLFGEPYNSRERFFIDRIGDTAGWLHAGRPRREAARIALRLHLRTQIGQLVLAMARLVEQTAQQARRHAQTLMADQTYLQKAQPSTFGHYLLSFTQPALRDGHRLLRELDEINASPGGAGCVNGTRLQTDRVALARSLGFDTECDLSFEATNAAERRQIATLRTRLIAHWLGCDEPVVSAAIRRSGGIVRGTEALRESGYVRLRPIELPKVDGVAAVIAAYHAGDPFSARDSWRCWRRKSEALRASARGHRAARRAGERAR